MDQKKLAVLGFLGYFKLTIAQQIAQIIKLVYAPFIIQLQIKLKGYQFPLFIRCGTSDYPCFHLIFIQEEFKDIYPLIPKHIHKMIDCGTNVGYTIKYFLEKRADLEVIGIEPDISNFKMAEKNLNYFKGKVQLLNKAIWTHQSFVKVVDGNYGNGGKWALTVVETKNPSDIASISLNDLISESQNGDYYVKMDIEGAEKIVLANETQWMRNTALLSVELHDHDCEMVFKTFQSEHQLHYVGLFEEMHCLVNPHVMVS